MELYEQLERQEQKVSFVIPVYKTEEMLEKCINSLLEQDYKNIELVVVFDGQSKKGEKIIRSFKDKRIVKVVTIEHGGAPRARNEGFKYVTGDFVSFWDSDCIAEVGMARMWVKAFLAFPDKDFVYSGYRFSNGMFLDSEEFNPYLITCYNYISTMFPMRKEVFPGFDESLESLQDWDMWIRVIGKGHKGWKNDGSAFTADVTRPGISADGCKQDTWLQRWNKVKIKHNIKRDCAFISTIHKFRGIELAEQYGWDYLDSSRFHLKYDYKVMYCIGFYFKHMEALARGFASCPKETYKVLHWTGEDVEGLHTVPYKILKELVVTLNATINKFYCENEIARQMLKEVGIGAEVKVLPMKYVDTKMPKSFNVYYEGDEGTKDILEQVKKSCPDIAFESPEATDLNQYACMVSLTAGSVMPSENLKRFLAAGRYVVTNYEMPYANKTDLKADKIIAKIRECRKLFKKGEVNFKAATYYKELIDIDKFKEEVIQGVINGQKTISVDKRSDAVLQCGSVSGTIN